jgi:hypothetical protein
MRQAHAMLLVLVRVRVMPLGLVIAEVLVLANAVNGSVRASV